MGVNGHKINGVVVNDAGNYTEESSIVQGAVQTKGAIGIVSVTPFMFEAYRWLQQNHIPVTGASSDGPEWGQPQNTNMFPSDTPAVQPNSPATAALSKLMKLVGAKNVASLGYSISPLSSQAAKNFAASAEYVHIKAPYVNTSVTFGATDFTSEALAIKNAGSQLRGADHGRQLELRPDAGPAQRRFEGEGHARHRPRADSDRLRDRGPPCWAPTSSRCGSPPS